MIECLSIVETDKVIHTMKTDIVKLVVEIKSFGMSSDEFDKDTGSSDGLQPKQADLSCVHALNELHLHEIRIVPTDPTRNLHGKSQEENHCRKFRINFPNFLSKDPFEIKEVKEAHESDVRHLEGLVDEVLKLWSELYKLG
ncbi:hypothetical protein Tco_0001510 [Tanacetum coccineum]